MGEQLLPPALGAVIQARRQELGWTQEALAARMAAAGDATFRQSDVSRLERGKVGLPHRARLERLAVVLDLPLGELLARSGWAGAVTAFPGDPSPPLAPNGASHTLLPSPTGGPRPAPPAGHAPRGPSVADPVRSALGAAIAQAQETLARTQQLLVHSRVLQERFAQGRRHRLMADR